MMVDTRVTERAFHFLRCLSVQDHSVAEQREYLAVVRELKANPAAISDRAMRFFCVLDLRRHPESERREQTEIARALKESALQARREAEKIRNAERQFEGLDAFELSTELLNKLKASPNFALAAARLAQRKPVVQPVTPTKKTKTRQWCIPFGPVDVPPGETIEVPMQLGVEFRGEKIVNQGDTDGLVALGLRVGRRVGGKSQFPTHVTRVEVKEFSPSSLRDGLRLDVCRHGEFIVWDIHNESSETRKFAATIIGSVPR